MKLNDREHCSIQSACWNQGHDQKRENWHQLYMGPIKIDLFSSMRAFIQSCHLVKGYENVPHHIYVLHNVDRNKIKKTPLARKQEILWSVRSPNLCNLCIPNDYHICNVMLSFIISTYHIVIRSDHAFSGCRIFYTIVNFIISTYRSVTSSFFY